MKTNYWDVLTTFHWDVVGCFFWDTPATLLGHTERRCYDVLLPGGFRRSTIPKNQFIIIIVPPVYYRRYFRLKSNFIEITHWHGCSPVNLLHIFRTPFLKGTSWWLLLYNYIHCKCVYVWIVKLVYEKWSLGTK